MNNSFLKKVAEEIINNTNELTVNKEQWKYTKSKKFDSFKDEPIYTDKKIDVKPRNNEIILNNGQFVSMDKNLNKNIFVSDINEALNNNHYNCRKVFNKIISHKSDLFVAYNLAFFNQGFFIHFKNSVTIDTHITITNYINNNSCLHSRSLFSIGVNTNIKLVLQEISTNSYSFNSTCEIFVDKNSHLEIVQSSEKNYTKQIANFAANIEKDSILKYSAIDINGKLLKNNYFINLIGENSQCYFNGLNILDNTDHVDSYIEIIHKNKFTYSNLNFRLITNGKSTSILYAKAIIEKQSSNSEAYQNNRNLMLSNSSTIHANPQLQINNNDVQCSHASATGDLDEDMIYYMQTRGIDIKDGKQLILKGFSDEIINNINIDAIQLFLKNKIEKYLTNVYQF